jgi:hypothetical protein
MVKGENVGALGEFHDNGVLKSIRAVVFGELGAQASSLDTNHGVELRIEIGGASEDLGRDLEFLNGGARVIRSVLRQIAEKFAQGLRAMQSMATGEPVNLLEKMLPFCHIGP